MQETKKEKLKELLITFTLQCSRVIQFKCVQQEREVGDVVGVVDDGGKI